MPSTAAEPSLARPADRGGPALLRSAQPRTSRPGASAGRTAPRPAASSDDARPTIGVDLGGTKVLLAVVAPSGEVLETHRHPTRARRGPDRIIADLISCLQTCLDHRSSSAVGIGIAGQIGADGVVRASPNLGWKDLPLRARVQAALGVPTLVTNDLRAITYGEWKFGAGRGSRDVACVFVGTGVGGGVVSEGQLRYGASDTAGEMGHMTIVANGRRCHCRNRGCLEAYVGGWAIAARAQEAARADPAGGRRLVTAAGGVDRITAESVSEVARAGDPLARDLVRETADYLAAGLVSVVNGFNPGVLILGGGVIEGTPSLVPAAASRVRTRALAVAVQRLRIVRAGLGGNAGVVGAAALAAAQVPGGI